MSQESLTNLDKKKCLPCRAGVGAFIWNKDKGVYNHIDILGGLSGPCGNSDIVKDRIYQNYVGDSKGFLLPKDELEEFYDQQADWWDDIIELGQEIFGEESQDKMAEIFNREQQDGSKLYQVAEDEDIEKELLKKAEEKDIEVKREDYPGLKTELKN